MAAEPQKTMKILVCGDVEGNFEQVFSRVETVHRKNGPFDMLLCTGNFFPVVFDETKISVPSAPIPTYILGPTSPSQANYYPNLNGAEISSNVTYLGK